MDLQELLDLASKATKAVWRQWGSPPWTEEDWSDLLQEARLGVWQITTDPRHPHPSRALLLSTACNAVRQARRWRVVGHNPLDAVALSDLEGILAADPDEDETRRLPPEMRRELARILSAARAPKALKSDRTQAALLGDLAVFDLLLEGYNNDGIALALGKSRAWVDQRRKRLKDALTAEALRQGLPAETVAALRETGATAHLNPYSPRFGGRGRHSQETV